MNRGSERAAAGAGIARPRFNEAPIHESGKFRSRYRRTGCRPWLQ